MKEGDTVLLPEYGGTEVKLCDKEYVSHKALLLVFLDVLIMYKLLKDLCHDSNSFWGLFTKPLLTLIQSRDTMEAET